MTIDSVRRISDVHPSAERVDRFDSGELVLNFDSRETKEVCVDESGYPFDQPEVLYGNYEYESEPLFGSSTTASGNFQIRHHSNLVLIESDGLPKAKTILTTLTEALGDDTSDEIVTDFRPHTESILEFIRRADTMVHARVLDNKGKVTEVVDEDDERLETHPIERIKLVFKKAIDGEEKKAVVTYSDDEIQFRQGGDEVREYVIQHFEASFASDA